MRIAIVMPQHPWWPLRFASLFPQDEVVLVGQCPYWDEMYDFDVQERMQEWHELVPNLTWVNEPHSAIDPHDYDVLLDDFRTVRDFATSWYDVHWDIPRVLRIGWQRPRSGDTEYIRCHPNAPVVAEGHGIAQAWHKVTNRKVHILYNSPGRWRERAQWVGDIPRALNVIVGGKTTEPKNSRNHHLTGVDIWEAVTQGMSAYLHDAYQDGFLSELEMTEIFQHSRCFVECTRGGRPLATTLIEAMAIGMPSLAFDAPDGDYKHVLGEFCFSDLNEMRTELTRILSDYEYACEVGQHMRGLARKLFGCDMLEQRWHWFFTQAQEQYDRRG